MKIKMFTVLEVVGQFYEGDVPGTVCFVPNNLIRGNKLDEGPYVLEGWASLNIKAQPEDMGIGSHLFPDLQKPYANQSVCAKIAERIANQRPQLVKA
jgi:hypothetical protein